MAIASLALLSLPVTALLVEVFLLGELRSILHMRQFDAELFLLIIALVASISGLILGIQSIRSDKRRIMGIVGTGLNSIAVGVTAFFLLWLLENI